MKISIVRSKALSGPDGTFGKMSIDGADFGSTCEQPWDDNVPLVSCIPARDYQLLAYNSPVHGETVVFHNPVLGVYGLPGSIPHGQTGRSLCEIHEGNWPKDVKGCVAVGRVIADISPNGRGVTDSRGNPCTAASALGRPDPSECHYCLGLNSGIMRFWPPRMPWRPMREYLFHLPVYEFKGAQ